MIAEWGAMVEHLYGTATPTGSTDPADERAASEAAANLMSGHGGFLYAPTAMARLVTQAIEIGYVTALRDMRDGRIDL